eukprot:TRINITY_DN16563_c0_g2_i1.p1 TRINITY_DN16563_c0_g2~~TRINITY_DN16563_c0_g2_i1.p1  ORF type:complete len:274 (+),score=32.65 TRINITY_DN16563_c0_g2_i1:120-941(+)
MAAANESSELRAAAGGLTPKSRSRRISMIDHALAQFGEPDSEQPLKLSKAEQSASRNDTSGSPSASPTVIRRTSWVDMPGGWSSEVSIPSETLPDIPRPPEQEKDRSPDPKPSQTSTKSKRRASMGSEVLRADSSSRRASWSGSPERRTTADQTSSGQSISSAGQELDQATKPATLAMGAPLELQLKPSRRRRSWDGEQTQASSEPQAPLKSKLKKKDEEPRRHTYGSLEKVLTHVDLAEEPELENEAGVLESLEMDLVAAAKPQRNSRLSRT